MNPLHKTLNARRWAKFSLAAKMANIASELARAESLEAKGFPQNAKNSLFRALELLDLTTALERDTCRRREFARVREILADSMSDGKLYGSRLRDVRKFLDPFAVLAAKERGA